MRNRALRPIATLLSLLLITSTTVQAGPISIGEVVQVIGRSQNSGRSHDLRFRNDSPSVNSLVDESTTKGSTGTPVSSSRPSSEIPDGSTAGAPPAADSLLSGVALSADDAQSNLDVISQGDLEGSICDCGEIPGVESHGGFPKWPLLFLAAIPFFFIHHHCDTCNNIPPPTPTPTPPVPEPASMLLMGSGLAALAASLRRRHARKVLAKAIASTEEA